MDIKQKLEECGVDLSAMDACDLDLEMLEEIAGGIDNAEETQKCRVCGETAVLITAKSALCLSCFLDSLNPQRK